MHIPMAKANQTITFFLNDYFFSQQLLFFPHFQTITFFLQEGFARYLTDLNLGCIRNILRFLQRPYSIYSRMAVQSNLSASGLESYAFGFS